MDERTRDMLATVPIYFIVATRRTNGEAYNYSKVLDILHCIECTLADVNTLHEQLVNPLFSAGFMHIECFSIGRINARRNPLHITGPTQLPLEAFIPAPAAASQTLALYSHIKVSANGQEMHWQDESEEGETDTPPPEVAPYRNPSDWE